jgi:hypothetical protein
MAATVASLAEHERSWKLRLAVVVALLFVVSAIVAVVGFAIREISDSWRLLRVRIGSVHVDAGARSARCVDRSEGRAARRR